MSTEDIMKELGDDPFANVTFTGGDPMYQPEGFAELADAIKTKLGKTIWCYTGFTFENLYRNERQRKLLNRIDVLVDGPFVEKLRNPDLLFRGSSNQRLIDVRKSIESGGRVVGYER
jgi:anaerobic ribonucleoside-triphosphate reductase activating protein